MCDSDPGDALRSALILSVSSEALVVFVSGVLGVLGIEGAHDVSTSYASSATVTFVRPALFSSSIVHRILWMLEGG